MTEETLQQKADYVSRIDKKAEDENISIKHAIAKLGGKPWAYYKYKAELRTVERERARHATSSEGRAMAESPATVSTVTEPNRLTLTVSDDVMNYLEQEAEGYATEPAIVAQLLLHDVVRSKIKTKVA